MHNLGQSFWLDNTTGELLKRGTLHDCIAELSVATSKRCALKRMV
jgi:hypothetical protein